MFEFLKSHKFESHFLLSFLFAQLSSFYNFEKIFLTNKFIKYYLIQSKK